MSAVTILTAKETSLSEINAATDIIEMIDMLLLSESL